MKAICVSIRAESSEQLFAKAITAAPKADMLELRFDSLVPSQVATALKNLTSLYATVKLPLLITYRPEQQGGFRSISVEQRISFWRALEPFDEMLVDIEPDIIESVESSRFRTIISSYHDFESIPENFREIITSLQQNADIAKVAFTVAEPSDALEFWDLLQTLRQKFIPIAMGEAGVWTRILSLANNSPITFASVDEGENTAPGQIPCEELADEYRVRELNKETSVYGLIGNPVSQSISPFIHNQVFSQTNRNAVYIPFYVDNLRKFVDDFVHPKTRKVDLNIEGLSVTIPFKQAIFESLNCIDDAAHRIGAINTLMIINDKLCGFNTDANGFIAPLLRREPIIEGRRVAVLGAGGSARAAVFALKEKGADVTIYARSDVKAATLAFDFKAEFAKLSDFDAARKGVDIIVNTTPLGMYGKFSLQSVISKEKMRGASLFYDLVYNPSETIAMKFARELGITTIGGLEMLVEQAVLQQKIWNGEVPNSSKLYELALEKLRRKFAR
ncbi:MAG: shikimate dehydrogenase [Pyrinomonadaceae bacterium]